MLLRKTLPLSDVAVKLDDGGAGRFSGYASVFGGVDSYGDTIVKGAFEYSLRTHGRPKMFLEHSAFAGAQGSAALPIGKYLTAKEDDHGLFVEGELTLGISLAKDVYAAMQHGTLDGLSIGGYVKRGDYDETETGRVIRRWSNLMEISPVAFPADKAARVESIKGESVTDAIAEIETARDIEHFLRDVGGLSKGAALALVARAKVVFGVAGDPGAETAEAKALADLAARLHQMQQRLAGK
jgi:HK97 family phage prohead protease